MKFHTVQVQQRLTDIWATRAKDGLDDGYELVAELSALVGGAGNTGIGSTTPAAGKKALGLVDRTFHNIATDRGETNPPSQTKVSAEKAIPLNDEKDFKD